MTEEFQILNFPLDPIVTLLSPFCHPFVAHCHSDLTIYHPFVDSAGVDLLSLLQLLAAC